ncbi:zinc ABC transporter permease AztB [Nocardiopsis kunsanensis]|uniref:ABC transporter permease n=1 Tax=Nocardiopsis kunsanensis TaxID=141693 RepID=A0A919CL55_9ACTN|nr:zinc ABC transporter permease AztB [Nocardiopsis kunsanensis]GHD33896.1 ABC transporter permease [Nocardiopsis kunsanensis]
MEALIGPFEVTFVQRALWGGVLVSLTCALAGTWVVLRGMAFFGEAVSHGMLPGVALASLLGGSVFVGGVLAAGAMAAGVTVLSRSPRLSRDTSIGLLFVGMLSVGVIVVSHSRSFAVDLTAFLFGDVLAVTSRDLVHLLLALAAVAIIALVGHRSFLALAFDPRKAHTLGLSPRWAHAALLTLVTLAVVASFHVVGTLLVFGMLIAPPATAVLWARTVPGIMLGSAVLGCAATYVGLLVSWHVGTAAGATITTTAVGFFLVSALAAHVRGSLTRRATAPTAPPVPAGPEKEAARTERIPAP